jgi:hypothetical protein
LSNYQAIMQSDLSDTTNSVKDGHSSGSGERDELLEVKKLSAKETRNIRLWRVIVTLTMLVAGTAVTVVAYQFLLEDEQESFESAVR